MARLEDWEEIGNALLKPFPLREIAFLPRGSGQGRALALAHVDARAVARRLDETVGPEGWYFDFDTVIVEPKKVMIKGKLTILGITKADAGEGGAEDEPLKSAVSDALKRSAVLFGIGRFLYELPQLWVPFDGRRFSETPRLTPAQLVAAAEAAGWTGDREALLLELGMDEEQQAAAPQPQANLTAHQGRPVRQDQQADTGEAAEGPTGAMTCATPGCGKGLTKGQHDVSMRAFGKPLCPACQRQQAQVGSTQAPTAEAPRQLANGEYLCSWPGCDEPLTEKVASYSMSRFKRHLCYPHQDASRAAGQAQGPKGRNTPATRPV